MTKPIITHANYNGEQLYVEWTVDLPPRFTGFVLDLTDSDGDKQSFETNETSFTKDTALSSDKTYTLTITVMVQDQPSSTSDPLTLISAAPTMRSVAYSVSPGKLAVAWVDAEGDGAKGIETYIATLTEFGKNTWNLDSNDGSVDFNKTLSSSESYSVTVRGSNESGTVLGPPSSIYEPIVSAPVVLTVMYDTDPSTKLSLQWQGISGNDIQYYITLEEFGKNTWNNTTAETTTTFKKSLSSSEKYSVFVMASDSTGIVLGPSSTVYTPISVSPELSLVSYDSKVLELSWSAADGEGVEAYSATLEKPGSDVWYSSTDQLNTSFNKNLDPATTYNTYVRATGGNGVVFGPNSALLNPLLTSATNFALIYTGTEIDTSWTADSNPVVSGYIVELQKNGAKEAENTPPESPSNFDVTMDDGGVYRCRIRSTAPLLQGPWSDYVYAPYAQAVAYGYDDLSRLTSVSWNTVNRVIYALDDPGNIDTRVFSQP